MALQQLFALRRERRRRADEQSREAGALIAKRLQELLGVPITALESETHPANARSENEYRRYPNEPFKQADHRVRLR